MITYLKRIGQLDKKIERLKKSSEEIELLYGQNYKYHKKQMEIEELNHLKNWYNEKIVDDHNRNKHRYCLLNFCRYYAHGKCFIGKEPIDNKCNFYDSEVEE